MTLVYTSTSGPTEAIVEISTPGPARHSTIRALSTDDIANGSIVGGGTGTLTDALDDLQGQLVSNRIGFVPVGSARIGTSFAGCVLEAATTWATPEQVPPGETFVWDLWAGGSGGCGGKAGQTGSAAVSTGAPAAGSAHTQVRLSRADILADLPFAISPGARGLGSVGASRLGNAGNGTTLPLASGTPGGTTSIGTLARVFAGGSGFLDPLGTPVNKVGATGGGSMSAGAQGTTTAAVAGGNPGAPPLGATGEGGAGVPAFVAGAAGLTAEHGGASCGCLNTGTGTPGVGGTSLYGSSAAGWGGQWSTGAAAANGANGGGPNPGLGGLAAAASGSGTVTGANGTNGGDGNILHGGSGGGGGGGARLFSTASPAVVRGGDGGDGGFPGGPGAGGGDASFGLSFAGLASDTCRGGDAGDGQDGLALCTIS